MRKKPRRVVGIRFTYANKSAWTTDIVSQRRADFDPQRPTRTGLAAEVDLSRLGITSVNAATGLPRRALCGSNRAS
jgi:hypothetical protein